MALEFWNAGEKSRVERKFGAFIKQMVFKVMRLEESARIVLFSNAAMGHT